MVWQAPSNAGSRVPWKDALKLSCSGCARELRICVASARSSAAWTGKEVFHLS